MSGEQPPGGPGDTGGPEDVGSLAEEAAKLFGALTDWAQDQAGDHLGDLGDLGDLGAAGARAAQGDLGDLGAHLAGLAGHAVDAAAQVRAHLGEALDDNLATGAPECRWCPVCRGVHAVRQVSPEVRAHLGAAASSLVQAAAAMMATTPPSGRGRDVETIDLDEDWPDDEPASETSPDPSDTQPDPGDPT
ncbi:MAG: hypothetical protein ABF306_09580 [Nocardioides marinisabuli]|uniref:hypothetical protein n=1 Tax=Nocardioides marinisabuli TaxID=419476 RepID=UPI00321A11C1